MKPEGRNHVHNTRAEVMKKVKNTLIRWWTEWLRSVLLIVLIITSFRSAVADWTDGLHEADDLRR
jgi:hypothetical protein